MIRRSGVSRASDCVSSLHQNIIALYVDWPIERAEKIIHTSGLRVHFYGVAGLSAISLHVTR